MFIIGWVELTEPQDNGDNEDDTFDEQWDWLVVPEEFNSGDAKWKKYDLTFCYD